MRSFMVDRTGEGPYRSAFEQSLEVFGRADPAQMAHRAGADHDPGSSVIRLSSLGYPLEVSHPFGDVTFRGTGERPIWQWQLVTLNYLGRADGTPLSGRLTAFRDLEGGWVFQEPFVRHTLSRLAERVLEEHIPALRWALQELGGQLIDVGDVGADLPLFPRFPVTVVCWSGEDEFPSSANVLFDSTANHYLHTEDASAAGSIIISFLNHLMDEREGGRF